MSGKLIVIEGLDGSGKSTQLELLPQALTACGIDVHSITFPDYNDPSSTLVKMYLSGEFGEKAGDVNAYAASTFYAVDRYASFQRHWKNDYEAGKLILSGRYTTSNVIHQTAKLDRAQWDAYIDWLYDFEFNKIGIPKPDITIYLDMPQIAAQKLMTSRYKGDETKKDVHERDLEYLENCRSAADFAIEKLGWIRVLCANGDMPYSVEKITEELVGIIKKGCAVL